MAYDREILQDAIDLSVKHENLADAARAAGVKERTFRDRVTAAKAAGIKPRGQVSLEQQIKFLKDELRSAKTSAVTHEAVRSEIIGLKKKVDELEVPDWTLAPRGPVTTPGVPTLFLSDLHWGERVDPKQIGGVNEYNLEIAHRRMDATIESAVHLLKIVDPQMRYPGLVLPLGGDMISGDIHEELQVSNEIPTIPTVIDLYGKLASVIGFCADQFKRVFVPCVTGNHGRNTHKIRAKDRHHTSFDWMLYAFLAKYFERDQRVTFYIPDGPDAYYRVYDHRYLLTHGDQFRGGDGMIGALGPIIRGDHKKRSRNGQVDMEYDTLVFGHWHQDIRMRRLIGNGSLKGYDEYAYAGNFGFEPPTQQLWLTHPKYRITYQMPVHCERQKAAPKTDWVAIPRHP